MKNLRKSLIIGVMGLTVFAMSGISFASAAAPQAGDLIKMDGLSAVYFLGNDGKRYVYPSESVFYSWHSDFSGVVTISSSELASYPLGANVVVRPGTKLVKITTDPSVYAVEANGTLRKIASEADAIAIFGANWAKRVIDVSDAFFTNYTISTPLNSGQLPAGTLVKNANSGAVYLFDGTNYRSIANEAAFNANRFSFANVVTISNAITAGGTAITGAESLNYDAQVGGGSGIVVTGSGLTASISAATPVSVSVPQNGTRIPMAKVNLTAANDGAVTVNSITVKRIGLSTFASIDKVWAEKDGVIIASKKSMNSNDESILTFSPAFTINAGQTVSLDLIASFPSVNGATGNIGLSIASASAISATAASVSGSFPINGNLMTPISYAVATLALTSSNVSSNVKVGDEKVELARFNVAFTGANAKDVTLKSIMVKNNGVEDLSKTTMNLYLEQAGNKVSTSYTIDGRYVTFYFPAGYELLKDDSSKDFYIKGDVISKENAAGISFALVLNKGTDLVAYEKSSGFGANVSTVDGYPISTITIDAGAVTVSKKVTSPSATSIIKGSDNTVLIANVRADEAITSDGLVLQYNSNGFATTTDQFENVRVYVNGVLLDSFDPASSSTAILYEAINSTFTLNKGDNEVKVMVRAKTTATTSAIFVARLDASNDNDASKMFYGMNPEYVISGNQAADNISGSASGEAFTVQGATLNVVRNDGYGLNKVIVQGSTDVSLGKFVLQSTNDEIKVTSIKLDGNSTASTTTTTASSIYDMKLYVDGVVVGSTVDFGTSGATFSGLNFTIAKDSTKNIEIKGSFDSAANGGFKTLLTVNAQDSRGTTVSGGISVIAAATTDFALSGSGTLTVDVAGNTPVAGLLATKAGLEQEVAQFKFTAINDSANLTEINVVNTAGSTTDARIASVKLYDGATMVGQFVPVNATGKFTINNNAIIVGANTSKTLSVKVVLNNIENDASSTNQVLQLEVTTVKSKSSAGALSTITADKTASSFLIRKTVPTIATMALPTSALTAGDQTIAKFTVTADANGDLEVGRFTITLATTTSASVSTSSLPLLVNGVTKTGAVATLVGNKMTISFPKEVVAASSSKTFEVVAVASASAANQSVTARLLEDAAYDADSSVDGVTGDFVWSDGASITTETWNSGHTVKGLPTTTWVLSN